MIFYERQRQRLREITEISLGKKKLQELVFEYVRKSLKTIAKYISATTGKYVSHRAFF